MYDKKIICSVLLVTYNHEKYIQQAIESILEQKTNFNYEIIVADDCSTDQTNNIIAEYANEYPELFKILPEQDNLGITLNYKRGFAACDGEYLAVLEGDDYWTDPQRLQKHVDFLESNKACVLTFNQFVVHDMKKKRHKVQPWSWDKSFQLINTSELVLDNFIGNFSTCVYRTKNIKMIKESLYELTVYDWMTNIVVSQEGLIAYLPEVMSVYRLHPNGTWSQKDEVEKLNETIKLIDDYDYFLEKLYHEEFKLHKNRLVERISIIEGPLDIKNKESVKNIIKKYIPPIFIHFLKLVIPPKFYK
ncbi:glycosyltransferase [Paenibacillus sp. FSL K6-1558]|uniref:glycosyltransferase n=1 Tax=Paenibacillus sp. FSL K6-1558 TaxID=2921473 RepID=UPI0012B805D2|nr:glycosyltransferase [Paenibacillus xylanexedens]